MWFDTIVGGHEHPATCAIPTKADSEEITLACQTARVAHKKAVLRFVDLFTSVAISPISVSSWHRSAFHRAAAQLVPT